MRTLVIVPAFNEARNLPAVLGALREHAPACDVCVVDDGSIDDTAQVARRAGAKVLRSPLNLGIGGAVQIGYLWAHQQGYDAAIQVDADGQHDPAFIESTLEPLRAGRADLVIGSRFVPGRESGFQSTGLRRAGIRYLSALIRLRCGATVTDPTSGFRAANRRVVELFARQYPPDYPEPESIGVAIRAGLRVQEVPVEMCERQHGESSIDAARTLYYLVKVSLALLLLPSRARRIASVAESRA